MNQKYLRNGRFLQNVNFNNYLTTVWVFLSVPNLTSFISSDPFLGWSFSMKFNLAKTEAIICPVNGYWNSQVFCKTRNNNNYTFIQGDNLKNSKIKEEYTGALLKSATKKSQRNEAEQAVIICLFLDVKQLLFVCWLILKVCLSPLGRLEKKNLMNFSFMISIFNF